MNELITSEIAGKTIRRNADNWFNLTDLATAGGKSNSFATDWVKGAGAEYIALAESKLENSSLLATRRGNVPERGIWAHYKIARRFAQAVSPEIAWHVDEIVEGAVSVAPIAEQSEARLATILERLTDKAESTNEKVDGLAKDVGELGEAVQRIEGELASRRKDFSRSAMNSAIACCEDHYQRNGNLTCPCCDRAVSSYQMHHWRGKGGNSPRILFPMHPECHKEAERQGCEWHNRKQPHFDVFQERCEKFFLSAKVLSHHQVLQVQPTLFGEIEASAK